MTKPNKLGLRDLRPNVMIQCFYCNTPKSQQGSIKFHAHIVCAECAQKLRTLKEKKRDEH